MSKMQLILFLTAILVAGVIVPASAQVTIVSSSANLTDNVTYVPVTGSVTFDPANYNNVTKVTDLTIYARSEGGIDTKVNPGADGKFSMSVPGAGNYSFWVYPSKLDYLNKSTNVTYQVQYPDMAAPYTQKVATAGLSDVAIPTKIVETGQPMNATPLPPTTAPTTAPQATPGFTMLAVLAAIGVVGALAFRKK
jgi:hypothetical protein